MLFQYKITNQNNIHIINVEGELVEKNQADDLLNDVKKALESGASKFVISFSQLGYMNSSGLGVLVKLLTKIRNEGGELTACCLNKKMTELLLITKLSQMFHIAENLDEALTELSSEK